MKSINRLAALLIASATLLVPVVASAAVSIGIGVSIGSGTGGGNNIAGVASTILYIINDILVPVLFAVAFIVFLYGVAVSYIFSRGDAETVSQGHRYILWGLIGFVVMISLWGLVNVISNTFGLSGYYAPNLPYAP